MWHAGGSPALCHDLMKHLFPGRTIRSRVFSMACGKTVLTSRFDDLSFPRENNKIQRVFFSWHAGRQSLRLDLMTYPFSGSTMRSRGFSCGMLEAVFTSPFDDLSFPRKQNAIHRVFLWHAGRQSLCLDLMTYLFSGSTMQSRGFSCGMLEAVLTSQFDHFSFPREHSTIQSVFRGMREGRPYVSI